jgi:RNA polymerase subunit RPABC4/transcription elongation factor Spt4
MSQVYFCASCGGLLEEGFNYCPRCGAERARGEAGFEVIIEEGLAGLEAKAAEARLDRLLEEAVELERDLSAMAENLEPSGQKAPPCR